MNENNGRPEWAQGPEWEGWDLYKGCHVSRLTRSCGPIAIIQSGSLYRLSGFYLNTASAALAIANLIAEDRGGWA